MPHERLQEFCIVDFKKEMVIIATIPKDEKEEVIGLAQYTIDESNYTAEIAMVVRDDYQNKGIGKELVGYLAEIAKKNGLFGFTAEVFADNRPALHLLDKIFETEKMEFIK